MGLAQRFVEENDINVLLCLFLPRGSVWKEDIDYTKDHFLLKLPKLKRSVCREAMRTWKKAALLWNSGKQQGHEWDTNTLSQTSILRESVWDMLFAISPSGCN